MSIETVARNEVCVYCQGKDVKGKSAAFDVMQGHRGSRCIALLILNIGQHYVLAVLFLGRTPIPVE